MIEVVTLSKTTWQMARTIIRTDTQFVNIFGNIVYHPYVFLDVKLLLLIKILGDLYFNGDYSLFEKCFRR